MMNSVAKIAIDTQILQGVQDFIPYTVTFLADQSSMTDLNYVLSDDDRQEAVQHWT
jgi:hypothetical protein